LSKEGGYIHLQAIDWTAQKLEQGVSFKLKKVPFKIQFSNWLPQMVTLSGG
jgi:hypothetical protein